MGIYLPNHLSAYSFKGNYAISNSNESTCNATNPITASNEHQYSKELICSEYSQAITANAMNQIAPNGALKYNITPEEYISTLTKAGQVKNKNFVVEKTLNKDSLEDGTLYISEFNSDGKKIKNTIFIKKPDKSNYDLAFISFTTPDTDKIYKWITYTGEKEGTYAIDKNDVNTGETISREWYNSDNTLDHRANMKNGIETSIEWYNQDGTLKKIDNAQINKG